MFSEKWNHFLNVNINAHALKDPVKGQGLSSTIWKGWVIIIGEESNTGSGLSRPCSFKRKASRSWNKGVAW